MFHIAKGTPELVRKAGEKWRPHKATRDSLFSSAVPHRGGYLIFARGGYEFMVLSKHVNGGFREHVRSRNEYPKRGTFNRCILGRNGFGASRRRAMRR